MGEEGDRPLTVITGDRKTRERRAGRRRALDQNEQITCWRCENDTGIATSMAVRVILAPRRTPPCLTTSVIVLTMFINETGPEATPRVELTVEPAGRKNS